MLVKHCRPGTEIEFRANGKRLRLAIQWAGGIVLPEGVREEFRRQAEEKGARRPCRLKHPVIDRCYLEVGGFGLWVAVTGWHSPAWRVVIDAPDAVQILDRETARVHA